MTATTTWPASRLPEAIAALAAAAWPRMPGGPLGGETVSVDEGRVGAWVEASARRQGLEAVPVEAVYGEVDRLLANAGPAVVRVSAGPEAAFLAVLGGNRRWVRALTPAHGIARLSVAELRDALRRSAEAPLETGVERLLDEAHIRRRRGTARRALFSQLLAHERIAACWMLRPAEGAGWATLAREVRGPRLAAALVGCHALATVLYIGSWWLLGWMSLAGRFEPGWMTAWLLLLLSLVPLRLAATAAAGALSLRVGAWLKRRLLAGALKLAPDEIRHLGVGRLLAPVVESEAVETLALAGGFRSITAIAELGLAAVVLASGAAGWAHAALLAGLLGVAGVLARRYLRERREWTASRLELTGDLVEAMVGHRTRLAQQPPERRHEGEDQALAGYCAQSSRLDRRAGVLLAVLPRAWLLLALAAATPTFVWGEPSAERLAVTFGGIALAWQAFRGLGEGLEALAGAWIAAECIAPYWRAAERPDEVGLAEMTAPPEEPPSAEPGVVRLFSPAAEPAAASQPPPAPSQEPLIVARNLAYRYRDGGDWTLRDLNLRLGRGDRVLLEGPSGGGKSTLAAMLAGARRPDAGLLLLDGADLPSLGADAWRRRVVIAPQFHENHVFLGSLAFNALMGRGWPPRPADLAEAEVVCRALDLGPLLDRMPAGMGQLVGETGWQLSHGERSRLYVARALLQNADLMILDESFAALDPQTLERTLAYVLKQPAALVVIAHP